MLPLLNLFMFGLSEECYATLEIEAWGRESRTKSAHLQGLADLLEIFA